LRATALVCVKWCCESSRVDASGRQVLSTFQRAAILARTPRHPPAPHKRRHGYASTHYLLRDRRVQPESSVHDDNPLYGPNQMRNQTKIVERLRDVHLIAFKGTERLRMRIAELERLSRRQPEPVVTERPAKPPSAPTRPEVDMMTERQVAEHLNMSVGSLRKWRRLRTGPRFVRIGRGLRYRRRDVEAWLDSCSGMA